MFEKVCKVSGLFLTMAVYTFAQQPPAPVAKPVPAFQLTDEEVKDFSLLNKDFEIAQKDYQIKQKDLLSQLNYLIVKTEAAHGNPKNVRFDPNLGYFISTEQAKTPAPPKVEKPEPKK